MVTRVLLGRYTWLLGYFYKPDTRNIAYTIMVDRVFLGQYTW